MTIKELLQDGKVVIVGGGLGGLATAVQLHKHGIKAHVYEKSISARRIQGTMITIQPNGSCALPHDLVIKLKEASLLDSQTVFTDTKGNIIYEIFPGGNLECPRISIPWKKALEILDAELPAEFKHYGYEFYDVIQDKDGATVYFMHENRKISVEASLLIGADGLRSSVRSSVFGYVPINDRGHTIWRAMLDARTLPKELSLNKGTMITKGEGNFCLIQNGVDEKLFWAVTTSDSITGFNQTRRSNDQHEMKETLLKICKEWQLVTRLIQATESGAIIERRMVDLDVLPRWSKGRIVLIGDAVHAVTPSAGQGANLAFEDGNELAYQLSSCSSLSVALQRYEDRRISRTKHIQEFSRKRALESPASDLSWIYNYNPNMFRV